ncbi:MAG: hypothetical protein ABSB49_15435 [Polyangia bacterium]
MATMTSSKENPPLLLRAPPTRQVANVLASLVVAVAVAAATRALTAQVAALRAADLI